MQGTYGVRNSKDYFRSQYNICFNSELYYDNNKHGGKVLMLFAEAFPFIVDEYGLVNTAPMILQYSNSSFFKNWFWKLKHTLGEYLKKDPTHEDIWRWIGKGFFLKICLNFCNYHNLFLNESTLIKMINKQKSLIKNLVNEDNNNKKVYIMMFENSYSLLNELTVTSLNSDLFYKENVI